MLDSLLAMLQLIWVSVQKGEIPELGSWSYVVLAFLIILQGPVMTILGAAAAATGLLRLPLVFLAGVIGNLCADVLWYAVGRAGKMRWFLAVAHPDHRPKHARKIEQLQAGMKAHATKLLLAAKLSVGFAVPTLIAVGLARVPWKRWFPVAFLGETLWTGCLVLLGYFAAASITQLSENVRLFMIGISLMLMVGFLWGMGRYLKKNTFSTTEQ